MGRANLIAELEKCGIMPTPQRLEIADILLAQTQHISADRIIDRLRESGSDVSKATVYNTLNLFGKRGLVRELVVDSKRRYYDSRTDLHHHFFNVDTGELQDIDDRDVCFRQLPVLPAGTNCDSVEVLIKVRNNSE
ncbi:MAG: transcriptional repressor [Gammaproteobacteria bacterium]|nr:transcriptional repressor [Gammaproteobacteria bacterium]